jgi:A/G-specific adenine glycosylase
VPTSVAPLRDALLAHFDRHGRDLPWRHTRDPYAIWVSEMMLQQTRAETVIPYYARFLERFPTPRALADAPLDSVLAAWAGLGYYRRARLLHAGARTVVERHDGTLPRDPEALRALPGVGAYTAGAIASIAFGLREPLVDGNVERVLTRLFALGGDPRTGENKKRLWSLARAFADCERPGDLNQSLMELGATVCVPVAPRCLLCPARAHCAAFAAGNPEGYPEKRERPAMRREAWRVLVAMNPEGTAVWLAPVERGRWEGMLLPPMATAEEAPDAMAHFAAMGATGVAPAGAVTHVLTHAAMELAVFRGTLRGAPPRGQMVPLAELDRLAVPKVTRAVVECAVGKGTVDRQSGTARKCAGVRKEGVTREREWERKTVRDSQLPDARPRAPVRRIREKKS